MTERSPFANDSQTGDLHVPVTPRITIRDWTAPRRPWSSTPITNTRIAVFIRFGKTYLELLDPGVGDLLGVLESLPGHKARGNLSHER